MSDSATEPQASEPQAPAIEVATEMPKLRELPTDMKDMVGPGVPELSRVWRDIMVGGVKDPRINLEQVPADAPPRPPFSPVVRIYAKGPLVVFALKDGREEQIVAREAMARGSAMMDGLLRQDNSKPRDELERECWLLENLIKAIQDSYKQIGRPIAQKTIDRALGQITAIRKRVLTQNTTPGQIYGST